MTSIQDIKRKLIMKLYRTWFKVDSMIEEAKYGSFLISILLFIILIRCLMHFS